MRIKLALKAGSYALKEKAKSKPNGGYKGSDGTRVGFAEAARALDRLRELTFDRLDHENMRNVTPCALCSCYGMNCKDMKLDFYGSHMCMKHGIEVTGDFFCKDGIDNRIGD